MWVGPGNPDGVYTVEEGVTGMVRTTGPVVTFNGACAQNIGEREMFIDVIGTKGGIRLQYGADVTRYSTKNGMLTTTTFDMVAPQMFEEEINSFIDCIETGKRLPSHIDTNIITAKMMDAIYRSADEHKEIVF